MPKTQRYFLQISYLGKKYHGWQIQPNAITIQEVMDKTLSTFLNEEIITVGAGRTDSGVHAEFFILHFDSKNANLHQLKDLIFRLNQFLPTDIAVAKIYPVEPEMHARFSAKSRTYQYRITHQKNPFLYDSAHYFYGSLDIDKMNKASEIIKKNRDFTSFSKLHSDVKTYICNVKDAKWFYEKDLLIFEITADRFLRNQVRALTGAQIDIGRDRLSLNDFSEILIAKDRSKAGFTAPAKGLFLTNIEY